jgi:hypothetical protein
LIICQMMRVISSPSSSTIGFSTFIFDIFSQSCDLTRDGNFLKK